MNRFDKISSLLIRVSMVAYIFSIVFAQTISFIVGGGVAIFLRVLALGLLLLVVFKKGAHIKKKNILNENNIFPLLMLFVFIPFLWNNAQFADEKWYDIVSYTLVFLYSVLLSFIKLSRKEIKCFLFMFVLFGIITSLFSWLQIVSENTYYAIVRYMFSSDKISQNIRFYSNGNLFGLTSHYSRNAFYIVISIIFAFFAIEDKKKYFLLVFFIATLLAVGKRGHLLFLVISAILAYFIIKRVKLRTVVRFVAISTIIIIGLLALSVKVPQIRHTIERAEESANSEDMTTGRSKMYSDAKKLYEDNGRIPIGWGKYASWTNYYHPALHNDYLQLYYEVGLIGEFLVVVPNIIFLIYSIKCARNNNYLAYITLVYNIFFMTYSLTGLPRYDQETQFVYYVLNSMMFAQLSIKGSKKNGN